MTNRDLIVQLLNTDLDAECELVQTDTSDVIPLAVAVWRKIGQHAVICSKCGCRVSEKACFNMRYCFICGAEMRGKE